MNTRREFMGGAAALAGAVRARGGADAPGAESFTLGVATYSLRGFYRPVAISILTKKLHERYINIKDFHLAMGPHADVRKVRVEIVNACLVNNDVCTIMFHK